MKQMTKSTLMGGFIPTLISACCTRSTQPGPLAMHSGHQKHPATNHGSLVEQEALLSPNENALASALEIFEDDEKFGFLPTIGFPLLSVFFATFQISNIAVWACGYLFIQHPLHFFYCLRIGSAVQKHSTHPVTSMDGRKR